MWYRDRAAAWCPRDFPVAGGHRGQGALGAGACSVHNLHSPAFLQIASSCIGLQVAIAAKEHSVPVYVAAESYKFARWVAGFWAPGLACRMCARLRL